MAKPEDIKARRIPSDQRRGRRLRLLSWLLVCLGLGLAGGRPAGAELKPVVTEYQVKAVFLNNFTKFTDWPASAFASSNAPMVIGIVGEDPFGKTIDLAVSGEVVRGHPLVVKRLRADEELPDCHVLFICRSEKERISGLLQKLKGRPVLTVSDAGGFAEQGGMVNFVLVQENVKLEINEASATESGLQISAKLLKLARIVKPN